MVHFLFDGFPYSLDAQHGEYFDDVVRIRPHRIDVSFGEHSHQRRSVGFQQPLGDVLKFARVRQHDAFLVVRRRQVHVHLGNCFNTLQRHVREHVAFDASQKDVVLHFVRLFFGFFGELFAFAVHDANTQNQLVGVVVVEDAVEVVAEAGVDLFGDLLHGELFVRHTFAVQLDT